MRPDRLIFRRASGLVAAGLLALVAVACAVAADDGVANDAGAAEASTIPGPDGAVDAAEAASLTCKDGRRRCVGPVLQVCDVGAWIELQTCLQGESCDVAVGICRPVDAGPDASSDAAAASDADADAD
ncbi:MAG: hypothetical protein QOI41_2062 [Myxococcales bacterium]|nr:hypothetical protein [Myxococcales bacterium]